MGYDSSRVIDPNFNSVGVQSAYPTDTWSTRSGAPAPVVRSRDGSVAPEATAMAAGGSVPLERRGLFGQPATWYVGLLVTFGVLVWISRKYSGSEKFGNIKLTLWNGVLMTIFYLLILDFLKVVTRPLAKMPILSGFADLVAMA